MSDVFFYKKFNNNALGDGKNPLREKFNEIIKDLKENNCTSQGDIKLIKGDGGVKYFRAKLSKSDRLLFTSIKHNNEDAFVILEVIPNHGYKNSYFLKSTDKIRSIEIKETEIEKSFDTVEIEDTPQVRWLGKFITLSAKQEDIVKDAEDLPLIVSGSAGSGKTSVALEKLRKIEEKFEEGKVLYITQSENLIEQSKELYGCEYWDENAGEFKVGVPDRIEFLSLHEFLEKKAEDIKGKKSIDRSKFFSWFNEICKKDKFKEYKKDGDKIFEEFTAVIAGGNLSKENYKEKLGDRQAIFLKEKRDNIYGPFEEYKEFIGKDSEYYDPNLIAHECAEEKIYDAVVVDEVQDLTESTLSLILKGLKDGSKGNFLLCGDVNQVIHPSFFSLSKLKSSLHKNAADKEPSVCFLEKNYRNSQQVIELASRVLHFKNYCFASEDKMTAGKKEAFFMNSDTENKGNVSVVADDKKNEMAKETFQSADWAILVLDNESKQDADKVFKESFVLNIHEVKGLEFKNVILYKFMSCKAYNGIWNTVCPSKSKEKIDDAISEVRASYTNNDVNTSRSKNKENKSFEEHKFYINALYVGASRAIDSVYIMDNEKKHNLLKVIKPEKGGNVAIKDIKEGKSSSEELKNRGLELASVGTIEGAKSAIKMLLSREEKKYAEEIMSALEAKGYHVQAQSLDKDKQASSEFKEETSQESSTSESRTPKSEKFQDEKHKSEKKKLTKKELEKNTKKLFSALEGYDSKKAKELIEQGINVNAKDNRSNMGYTPLYFAVLVNNTDIVQLLLKYEELRTDAKIRVGCTPLHLAAQMDRTIAAKLLLEHGADVDAKDNMGYTPLHWAARNDHYDKIDTAKLLLEHGADVNAKTKEGLTPLDIAVERGHKNVVELLRKYTKENPQPKSDVSNISVSGQGFKLGGV